MVPLLRNAAQAVAAALMAALFLVFVLQIAVRYAGRSGALVEAVPLLDPIGYGWTLELCLLLWIWLVFWGNAFVVRDRDHVRFDILHAAAGPRTRRLFGLLCALAIGGALLAAIGPTWEKFAILRLKRTATLSQLFGDGIRMRHVYAVFPLFLLAVGLRQLHAAWRILRGREG